MSWLKAFFAGIVGAALITVMLSIAISAGFHVMDFSMMWGTLVGLPIGWVAWIVGFGINLLVGGVFALWYAVLFKLFAGASLLRGLLIGIAHAFITGLIVPLLPLVHPLMNNGHMASPGPYFSEHGTAGVFFFFRAAPRLWSDCRWAVFATGSVRSPHRGEQRFADCSLSAGKPRKPAPPAEIDHSCYIYKYACSPRARGRRCTGHLRRGIANPSY